MTSPDIPMRTTSPPRTLTQATSSLQDSGAPDAPSLTPAASFPPYHKPMPPLSDHASSPFRLWAAGQSRSGQEEEFSMEELRDLNIEMGEKHKPPEFNSNVFPPSPPLTRVGTNESNRALKASSDPSEPMEVDITNGWHPLGHDPDSTRDNPSTDGDSAARQHETSHPPMELRNRSPQPWEVLHPLSSNDGHTGTEVFSTIGSKNFETLQRQARSRPSVPPRSAYYFGPPPVDSAYGTSPIGQIGIHHPREIVRIERDYGGGEIVQFSPTYPLELEGRITPTQFLETINAVNEILISAHSVRHAFIYNLIAILSVQISTVLFESHYDKEMRRLKRLIDLVNAELYNPVGLNILWPRKVAFLFLEIEYY